MEAGPDRRGTARFSFPSPASITPARRTWRLIYFAFLAVLLVAIPWSFHLALSHKWNVVHLALFVSACCVASAVPISVYQVACHLENFARPQLQLHVVRILWMVPVYGVDSWLALVYPHSREYLYPLREFYEAYVIYSFHRYLVHYLEDEVGRLEQWTAQQPQQDHIWGFQLLLRPWPMGERFLFQCRSGVLAYVVVRPLTTLVGLITASLGVYGEGQWRYDRAFPYTTMMTSLAQLYALYCLALFYHATAHKLKPIRPLQKFVTIKMVVFLSYWQGVTLTLAGHLNLLRAPQSLGTVSQAEIAACSQDFLICVEMFVAALAHEWAFSYKDYLDPSVPARGIYANMSNMWDVRDVVVDINDVGGQTAKHTAAKLATAGRRTLDTAGDVLVRKPYSMVKDIINPQVATRFTDGEGPAGVRQPLLADDRLQPDTELDATSSQGRAPDSPHGGGTSS